MTFCQIVVGGSGGFFFFMISTVALVMWRGNYEDAVKVGALIGICAALIVAPSAEKCSIGGSDDDGGIEYDGRTMGPGRN